MITLINVVFNGNQNDVIRLISVKDKVIKIYQYRKGYSELKIPQKKLKLKGVIYEKTKIY